MSARSGALLLGAVMLQVTLLGRLPPAIPEPNLVLALVVARAFLRGGRAGMIWALAGGLLLDLAGTGPLGVHALAMLAAAYAAGVLGATFENRSPGLASLAGAAGSAVYAAVVLGAADSLGLADVAMAPGIRLVLAGSLVGGILTLLVALPMRRLEPGPAAAW